MQDLFEAVERNKYGFYELQGQYRKKMDKFYEAAYFQSDKALYKREGYSDEELTYKKNLLKEKEYIFETIALYKGGVGNFLDVGCGEGYALNFFFNNGWNVCGIDLSDYGIKAHNPAMEKFLIKKDLMTAINGMSKNWDFINMDNVLEHLPNPVEFLGLLRNICSDDTIVCIRVPNDFSITQKTLYKNGYINDAFFVTKETSEHFNYFTLESLTQFVESNGFEVVMKTADYPIDFNLFNPRTNYVAQPELGHDGHIARLKIENMLFETSLENTIKLHQSYAECGIGRDISVYMKLNDRA